MKRAIMILCGALLSWNAGALELAGIPVAQKVQMENVSLLLNGAGIRSKNLFDIYICALYLPQKQTSAEAIVTDTHERRVKLHFLYSLGSARLLKAFNEAIEANYSPAELATLSPQLKQMDQIFGTVDHVKVDDVITLDYLPGTGTRINLNGRPLGTIPGIEFNRALLKIWLGNVPVQADLKKAMLGG